VLVPSTCSLSLDSARLPIGRRLRHGSRSISGTVKEWTTKSDPTYADRFNRRVVAAREFGKSHLFIDLTDDAAHRTFEMVMRRLGLSIGIGQRILRVARTIANLDGSECLKAKHIAEAVQYKVMRGLTYE
jgi:predicted ATPase with chaperone activity